MRVKRPLLATLGAFALTAVGGAAFAQEPTSVRLIEEYDITPGVSATHEVTLSADEPLSADQCEAMGSATGALSSLSVSVDGVSGCRFTWQLADAGAEVISVDTGGVFHFESASSRLLEGYSSPEASATITRVTLIAHSSQVEEASAGATIISYAGSTKKDATTVTWENVSGTVSATGTVTPSVAADAAARSTGSSSSASPSTREGDSTSWWTLWPFFALAVVALGLGVTAAVARSMAGARRAAADARFDRDRRLRAALREAALPPPRTRDTRGGPAHPAQGRSLADSAPATRFAPPERD